MEQTENGNYLFAANGKRIGKTLYIHMLPFNEKNQNENGKTEDQAIFLNPFVHLAKQKFVVCPFVDEETNECYPFAYGLNGLTGLNGLNGLS